MTQKLNNLMWFKNNIELQLEDLELEQQGNKIILYFDTSDIQTAVTGLQAFYINGQFKRKRFDKKKTFVNTLISVGWLGEFNLLPPHLSEFYGKAERNFNLKPTTDWENEVKKFIKDLNLLGEENTNEIFQNKSAAELQEIFSKQAGRGIDWFNAIYSMTPWHRKLGVWLRTGLLNMDGKNFDYESVIKSKNFEKLKELFDEHRKSETINNIVDAAALAYLIELVEKFNLKKTFDVPRFFIPRESSTVWQTILQELKWDEKFVCRFDFSQGSPSSVFREEDYYLYKITFRRHAATGNGNALSKENLEQVLTSEYEKLSDWKNQAEEAIKALPDETDELYNQTLTKIHINQDLEDLIDSLQQYSVLETDWFKNASGEEFLKIINESKESKAVIEEQREIYEDKNFKKFITAQLKDKKEELIEELEDFRLASQLYDALYNSIEGLRRRIKNAPALESDELFSHLGLLRYGFPAHIQQLVTEILSNLRSGESDNIRSGCAEVIKWYIDGRRKPAEKVDDLMAVTGVLLAVGNNDLLEKLFTSIESNIPHFSLKVAYSEFLFRREPRKEINHSKALRLLGELENEWKNDATGDNDKAHLAVGLAYLYYWAWRSAGAVAVWDLQIKKLQARANLFLNRQIDKSIFYADYAYSNLPDAQIEKKVYALNQYLFYSIEGGDSELFRNLKERKDELQNHLRTKAWQFRFDDTLARYYFRKAFLPNQENERKKIFIEWAKDYEDKAKNKSDGDIEIDMFHDRVKQIWEDV